MNHRENIEVQFCIGAQCSGGCICRPKMYILTRRNFGMQPPVKIDCLFILYMIQSVADCSLNCCHYLADLHMYVFVKFNFEFVKEIGTMVLTKH